MLYMKSAANLIIPSSKFYFLKNNDVKYIDFSRDLDI